MFAKCLRLRECLELLVVWNTPFRTDKHKFKLPIEDAVNKTSILLTGCHIDDHCLYPKSFSMADLVFHEIE